MQIRVSTQQLLNCRFRGMPPEFESAGFHNPRVDLCRVESPTRVPSGQDTNCQWYQHNSTPAADCLNCHSLAAGTWARVQSPNDMISSSAKGHETARALHLSDRLKFELPNKLLIFVLIITVENIHVPPSLCMCER